ncbi:MAG: 2-C-methyl-D-erythritol 4-phosphate cytidylyltransferase [Lachnospiraceae bacterium]|nr:2-C-methyl-D-erythritol 4-phosphate cytidylyltransferase [Lachnospiraceae bacterium]
MKHIAIVMAAGSGKRMGGDIPKQFLLIRNKPVLYYTLKTLEESFIDEIILVTRHEDISYCEDEIVKRFGFKKVKKVVPGGAERYLSVYEGLKSVEETDSYIYIQDGARPLLTEDILLRVKESVEKYDATVTAVESKDTVKIADDNGFVADTPLRKKVWNAQTPQAFLYKVIKAAYDKLIEEEETGKTFNITDDSQVCELFSKTGVYITKGDYNNIKITTESDLATVEKILENL